MIDRRGFLGALAALPLVGNLIPQSLEEKTPSSTPLPGRPEFPIARYAHDGDSITILHDGLYSVDARFHGPPGQAILECSTITKQTPTETESMTLCTVIKPKDGRVLPLIKPLYCRKGDVLKLRVEFPCKNTLMLTKGFEKPLKWDRVL